MNDYTEVYGETLAELMHDGSECLTCGDTGWVRIADPYGDFMVTCECQFDESDDVEESDA